MPDRAPHFCAEPGCNVLASGRRCRTHAALREHERPNYALRRQYRTPQWKALRARILRDQAYQCADCKQILPRLEVDHIAKHHGNMRQFWNRANLQALCRTCHQRKTRRGE